MGDNRPLRYTDPDGTVVYRASGLGACDGVVLGLARGRVPNAVPEWLQEVFDEGTRMEGRILDMLLRADDYGPMNLDEQTEWTLDIGDINDRQVIVRGHSDGWDIEAETIVEAKKFRPSTWPKFLTAKVECNPLYPWQVSTYMHAARQLGIEARLLFVGGEYLPEEDDIASIEVFEYDDPPIPLKAIRKRIARWENMIADGLDVTDLAEPCSARMFPCPMFGKGCPSETAEDERVEITGKYAALMQPLLEEIERQGVIAKTATQMLDNVKKVRQEQERKIKDVLALMVSDGVATAPPAKFKLGDRSVTHVASEVAERVQKGYRLDYMKITNPGKDTPK